MIDINKGFPVCAANDCHKIEAAKKFAITDTPEGKSCIFKGDTETLPYPYFTVLNPNSKEINFLAIDNCIFFACDGKKCDFAVFDDSIICFVEIKLAAGKRETRRRKKKDATVQLKTTIGQFKDNLDLTDYKIEACLCVGYKTSSPRSKASNQGFVKEFFDLHNAELFEGNEMSFD